MKKLLYTLAIVFVPSMVLSQTTTENYLKSTTYQVETQECTTNANTQAPLTNDEKIEAITYFDGLGRPMQSVGIRAGGNDEDVITQIDYDNYGRQDKDYLPYAITSNGGLYRTDALSATGNFYNTNKYENSLNPYSEKNIEASPLNRVLEQAAPGNDWALDKLNDTDHTIKFDYLTNTANEVIKFDITFPSGNTGQPQLQLPDSYYGPEQLYKTVTKDENWKINDNKDHTTEEFKDKQGRIILKRTYNNQKPHSTHYVYDDFGNLTYVIPPLASDKVAVYDVGMTTLSASDITTSGNATGTVQLGIEQTGTNTYRYAAVYDLHNLENSSFINSMELPHAHEYVTGSLGGINLSGNGTLGRAFRYLNFSTSNGLLTINNGGFTSSNYNGDPLIISDFSQTSYINLPQTLEGVTEAETQANLQGVLDDLCYQYKYDHRNRLVEKKIPGKDWEYIVYDKLHQPVMTQDANLRASNQWLFTKYDVFGRVAYTGLYVHGLQLSQQQMQAHYDSQNAQVTEYHESRVSNGNGYLQSYYTNTLFPDSSVTLYTVNYYDDYGFSIHNDIVNPGTVFSVNTSSQTKGLPTGQKIRTLDTNQWSTTVSYYDDKGRAISTRTKNDYLNTVDIIDSELDFVGNVIRTRAYHTKGNGPTLQVDDVFDYDHMSRLLSQKQTIYGQSEELIAKNHYDELGQLVKKDLGDTEENPLQEVDYTYNIRGWLRKINDIGWGKLGNDLFSFELNYNDGGTKLYNGNISRAKWVTASDENTRQYYYYYDDLNRLTSAKYYEWSKDYRFNVNYSYDKNGNLSSLNRKGAIVDNPDYDIASDFGTMDNLAYAYEGNQLMEVTDSGAADVGFRDGNITGDDYVYDDNGNMTSDANKGITNITYNHLNLPTKVSFGATDYIDYFYDATGIKLKKVVSTGTTIEYAGNYVYENGTLKFFNHAEGYVDAESGSDYVYQLKDHLGNVRLSYKENTDFQEEEIFFDGFESVSGWDGTGNTWGHALTAFDSSFKRTGNYSGRIDAGTNGEVAVHSTDWPAISITESTYYTVSAWVYLEDVPNNVAGIWLFMKTNEETGYYTELNTTSTVVKGQWFNVRKSVLVQPNIEKLNVRIDNRYDGKVWFDDVQILKGNTSRTEIVEENNYYPFGLKHKGYNTNVASTNIALKKKFGGKELNDELGLDWYDFGARNYDAALGRWMNLDPLADFRYEITPYNYVQNSPMFRIDPDGLTDYKLNKDTGEVEKYQDTDDKTDRVVKTDSDGNVKKKGEGFLGFLVRKSERGKAKTAFGSIEKGILEDGQNFRTNDNVIEVGGEGPSVKGVKSFTLQLSEYIGNEIKGFSYSSNSSGNVTDMVLGKYIDNDYTSSYGTTNELRSKYGVNFSLNNVVQQFHTHPDGKLGATQSDPSQSKDVTRLQTDKPFLPNATFIILYRISGQKQPKEYDYTHEYRP